MRAIFLILTACLASLVSCGRHEPVGVVLVYEIVETADAAARPVSLEKEVEAVRKRLQGLAHAEPSDGGQIVVSVYGADATRVRQRLSQAGVLEFRIVANRRDVRHRDIIALTETREGKAEAEDTSQMTVLDEGKPAAKWVKIVKDEADSFVNHPDFLTRAGPDESLEVLVMIDPFHVTGDYPYSVSAGKDRVRKPCINFVFNSAGARRFGKLTGANLPDPATGDTRQLAIILDGHVFSAPAIRGRIDERGEITGSFSEKQVEDLAAVLMAGSLPAPLRLVEERPAIPAN